jgi:CRP-like cAMP-binding protein
MLIHEGARGDSMYFICSGEVEVHAAGQSIKLARGDFFGEMALLLAQPRQADVTAVSYCLLLILEDEDFQALLKGSAVVAGQRVVVAGTGPFLLPVAVGLAQAGARVAAVVEANQPLSYLRQPLDLARSGRKLPEAAGYLVRLARRRVPVLRRHAVVAAHGDGRLRAVTVARLDPTWAVIPGSQRTLDADVLAVGYGFIPQVELLGEAGAQLRRGPGGNGFRAGGR